MTAATRVGDADVPHCSGMVRAEGSPDVLLNDIPWSRQGDVNTPHLLPGNPCPTHTAPIALGSPTVIVNGVGAGRIGDAIAGCTSVAAGSPNVFCGPTTDSPVALAEPADIDDETGAVAPPGGSIPTPETIQNYAIIDARGYPYDLNNNVTFDIVDLSANTNTVIYDLNG